MTRDRYALTRPREVFARVLLREPNLRAERPPASRRRPATCPDCGASFDGLRLSARCRPCAKAHTKRRKAAAYDAARGIVRACRWCGTAENVTRGYCPRCRADGRPQS